MRRRRAGVPEVPPGFDMGMLTPIERAVHEAWREGRSVQEVAEEFGLTRQAVASARHRLRNRFERFRLSPEGRRMAREHRKRVRGLAVEIGLELLGRDPVS